MEAAQPFNPRNNTGCLTADPPHYIASTTLSLAWYAGDLSGKSVAAKITCRNV
jgi:hypothetical protein